MRLAPLDLRRAQFGVVLRGFDRAEVASFLSEAADDFEKAVREADRARQEVGALHDQLEEHRQREATLRDTLLTAQRVSSEVRESAKHEAELLVREARGQADEIVHVARTRCLAVERELADLSDRRSDAERSLEDVIATLRNALDVVKRPDRERSPDTDAIREDHSRPATAAGGPVRLNERPTVRPIAAAAPGSSA
jgi:cell division initiation protein